MDIQLVQLGDRAYTVLINGQHAGKVRRSTTQEELEARAAGQGALHPKTGKA